MWSPNQTTYASLSEPQPFVMTFCKAEVLDLRWGAYPLEFNTTYLRDKAEFGTLCMQPPVQFLT